MGEQSERHAWFDRGVRALARALAPAGGDCYVCPLCRTPVERDLIATELTVEHAPPESIGGHAVALTCRACNSHAGAELDEALRLQYLDRQLFHGGSVTTQQVVSVREGTRARGQLTFGSEEFRFDPIPAQNHPEELRAFRENSERSAANAQGGQEIVLEIPMRASPRRASLSLIRAAFVVAFATFGYTYALDPAMDPLLEQIRRPADLLIDPLPIHYDETTPSDLREISIIREPETLHSVLVRMGDAAVFLPVPHDMVFFAEFPRQRDATAPLESNPYAVQLLIERFDWPTSPQHLLD